MAELARRQVFVLPGAATRWALPVVMLGLAGWIVLVRAAAQAGLAMPLCAGGEVLAVAFQARALGAIIAGLWPLLLVHSLAMAAIMVLPVLIDPVRHVARSTFDRDRAGQVVVLVASFLLPWVALSLAVSFVALAVAMQGMQVAAGAIATGLAAMWQFSDAKRAAVVRCHATRPVYSGGWRGVRSTAVFGKVVSLACIRQCGPMMAAAMIGPAPFPALLAAVALTARERYGRRSAINANGHMLLVAALGLFVLTLI